MRALIFTVSVLLAGCAGSQPERHAYLLRADVANQFNTAMPVADISIGALGVADYIDQPGLVLENADGTITTARFHEWAEPLRESLRLLLADEIANRIGKPVRARGYGEVNWRLFTSRLIDIQIEQLHGTTTGDAILVAYWSVVDPQQKAVLSEHEFRATTALTTDGYPALVTAEKQLLEQLAADIAAALAD